MSETGEPTMTRYQAALVALAEELDGAEYTLATRALRESLKAVMGEQGIAKLDLDPDEPCVRKFVSLEDDELDVSWYRDSDDSSALYAVPLAGLTLKVWDSFNNQGVDLSMYVGSPANCQKRLATLRVFPRGEHGDAMRDAMLFGSVLFWHWHRDMRRECGDEKGGKRADSLAELTDFVRRLADTDVGIGFDGTDHEGIRSEARALLERL